LKQLTLGEAEIKYSKKSQFAEISYESCNYPHPTHHTTLTPHRDCEYIAWSLPKPPFPGSSAKNNTPEPRGKFKHVGVKLIALCSPGAAIFSGKQFAQFTATAETRCVRDIKRLYSWKVYGVSYNSMGEKAHYVRIQLEDKGYKYPSIFVF
jgi:hypothetical protein